MDQRKSDIPLCYAEQGELPFFEKGREPETMTPIEHYWPPEMLAEVFPERYGHLVFNWAEEEPASPPRYTVDQLPGRCVVIRLPGGQVAWRAAHKPETSSQD